METQETLISFQENIKDYKCVEISENNVNKKYEKTGIGKINTTVAYKTKKIRKSFRKSMLGRIEVKIMDDMSGTRYK